MRYFLNYRDDTLRPLETHESGELVGRKPLVVNISGRRNVKHRTAASVKLGRSFIKKLDQLGL